MSTVERDTAVGVFVDRTHAEQAVAALQQHGFAADQIGFIVPDEPEEKVEAHLPPLDEETRTWEGAMAGAGAGGALGTLLGVALTAAALPGVGAALVGGLLAGGMAGGGILGALIGLNVPEDEARHYESEFHSGRTLVTVRAGERFEEAVSILRQVADNPQPWGPREDAHRLAGLAEGSARPSGGGTFVPRP